MQMRAFALVGLIFLSSGLCAWGGAVQTLKAHRMIPVPSITGYFGCKPGDCYEGGDASLWSNRRESKWGAAGARYIVLIDKHGSYVDPNPLEPYVCARGVTLSSRHSASEYWLVQVFRCERDPHEGTFLGALVGIVLCDTTSADVICSDFTPLEGFSGSAPKGGDRLAPVKRVGDDVIILGQRFRLSRTP
jgi:hypothetical protein